ncbi:MAG: hypothetical protein JW734_09635 [Candidatus Omnitrophica bacterium]|nr:hypothetical protein [Candidatus Omnitrophota bacterium]
MEESDITQNSVTDEVRKGAGLAALSYVFFICICILIYKKDNEFARFHAKQALVLFIGWVICLFLSVAVPFVGGLFSVSGTIIYLVCLSVGIFSSLMGLRVRFPVITSVAEKMVI